MPNIKRTYVASRTNPSWKEQAYPLKRITIELQVTRHSDIEGVLHELDEIREKLLEGYKSGSHHDDDFGYRFVVCESETASIFGAEPASMRWAK